MVQLIGGRLASSIKGSIQSSALGGPVSYAGLMREHDRARRPVREFPL
jgi:hypothetical protein